MDTHVRCTVYCALLGQGHLAITAWLRVSLAPRGQSRHSVGLRWEIENPSQRVPACLRERERVRETPEGVCSEVFSHGNEGNEGNARGRKRGRCPRGSAGSVARPALVCVTYVVCDVCVCMYVCVCDVHVCGRGV